MSLHQSSRVDFLVLRALIRTASSKEEGRNTEVITRAYDMKGHRSQDSFIHCATIDEDEDDN